MLVVSTGCPSGIGPEVSVAAAARLRRIPRLLVGDLETLRAAAEIVGVDPAKLLPCAAPLSSSVSDLPVRPPRMTRGAIPVWSVGPKLSERDRQPGRPTKRSGQAQLAYIDAAFDLARAEPGRALVTGPVSKAVIARSGADGAEAFLGHTEWLQVRDGAQTSVMCFASSRLVSSLATTHVPVSELPRAITRENVSDACFWLARLLLRLDPKKPKIAVCSLNPHAGESELLGREEHDAIVPGIRAARRRLRASAELVGPIGAETAFRKAHGGDFDGVVAMYHDQATIPMKLVAFGEGVNVTMGLSVIRTSVDHGTGYDIAWTGRASDTGMYSAMKLAARMIQEPVNENNST